jgi:uncharacterized membrane protein (UPF0136 family)
MSQQSEETGTPGNIWKYIRSSKWLRPMIGIVIGGTAGYLYYHFIGCSSGTCAITSSPYLSTLMGGFMGFFVVNSPCSKSC